jgi:pyruvate/2-oxoacid:ferredoxin oxidoreductase alpha subunit
MMGSFATKAKAAVEKLRAAGQAVGLLRPRLFRPFPTDHIRRSLAGKQGVAVIDQNLSVGKGGVLHSELASVLCGAHWWRCPLCHLRCYRTGPEFYLHMLRQLGLWQHRATVLRRYTTCSQNDNQ